MHEELHVFHFHNINLLPSKIRQIKEKIKVGSYESLGLVVTQMMREHQMLRILLLDLLAIPLLLGRLVIIAVNNHRVIVTLTGRLLLRRFSRLLGRCRDSRYLPASFDEKR